MIGPTTMPDASALGVGTDNELCARADLNAHWATALDKRGLVIRVLVVQDRTFWPWCVLTMNSTLGPISIFNWAKALDKGGVVNDESILCNGNILAMGTDNAFCTKSNLCAVSLRVPDRKSWMMHRTPVPLHCLHSTNCT